MGTGCTVAKTTHNGTKNRDHVSYYIHKNSRFVSCCDGVCQCYISKITLDAGGVDIRQIDKIHSLFLNIISIVIHQVNPLSSIGREAVTIDQTRHIELRQRPVHILTEPTVCKESIHVLNTVAGACRHDAAIKSTLELLMCIHNSVQYMYLVYIELL